MWVCRSCGGLFDQEDAHDDCGVEASLVRVDGETWAPDALLGQTLDGRYVIHDILGIGGMGVVYRATQVPLQREVALKVIRGEVTARAVRRFFLEARSASRLRTEHVARVHELSWSADGLPFMAMEFVDGATLEAVLEDAGAMPWPRALSIADQIAECLAEAHEQGIVHRDLKPRNIVLTRLGETDDFVKVLDFGVAKLSGRRGAGLDGGQTTTGRFDRPVGTPLYTAPEQARREVLDGRADLYSLGVILYELLTGSPPFVGPDPVSTLLMHCQDDPPAVRVDGEGTPLPEGVVELVGGLLAKRRDERVDCARSLRSRIATLLYDHRASAPSPRSTRPDLALRGSAPGAPAVPTACGSGRSPSVPGPRSGATEGAPDLRTTTARPRPATRSVPGPARHPASAPVLLVILAAVIGLAVSSGLDPIVSPEAPITSESPGRASGLATELAEAVAASSISPRIRREAVPAAPPETRVPVSALSLVRMEDRLVTPRDAPGSGARGRVPQAADASERRARRGRPDAPPEHVSRHVSEGDGTSDGAARGEDGQPSSGEDAEGQPRSGAAPSESTRGRTVRGSAVLGPGGLMPYGDQEAARAR
ncbi:MAG: protein kinase domain-containing protein [Myxococcota bacterium]